MLAEAYGAHRYLLTEGSLHAEDARIFAAVLDRRAARSELVIALNLLSRLLATHHGEQVVILLDEYDSPIHAGYSHKYYDFAACSAPAPLRVCDDPGPLLIRGAETGFDFCTNGPAHRSKIVACAAFEHAAGKCGGTEMSPEVSQCATNADCVGKEPQGVCFVAPGNVSCGCAPSCTKDADCGPDSLCQCGDPISFCRQALCHSDADCDGGALCMDSEIESCGERGFACQSPLDECLSSLDCAGGAPCIYITDHRVCTNKGCEG